MRCTERQEMGVVGINGGYAQYLTVPSRFVHRLPPDVEMPLAVLSHHLSTTVKGLKRLARAWPAEPAAKHCAVVGMGPLGHLCALVLAHKGHRVSAFDHNADRLRYFEGSNILVARERNQLSEADALVETTGDPGAVDEMMAKSMPGAAILLLGVPMAHQRFTFRDTVAYDRVIVGSVGAEPSDIEEALELMPYLALQPFLENMLPLDQFALAWGRARAGDRLKTILEIDS